MGFDELSFTRPDGDRAVRIEFPDSETIESLAVTVVSPGQYQLDESPVFSEYAKYGDVIEADVARDGLLVCRGVVSRSDLRTVRWLATSDFLASAAWEKLKTKVIEVGGNWEQVFGGYLILHYPKSADVDLERSLRDANVEIDGGAA